MKECKMVIENIKKYIPVLCGSMLFSVVVYTLLIVNQLVNSIDGLWEYSYHKAGAWELSLGRWFWLYLDRMRLGISVEPLTSLMTLFLFSFGLVIMLELFDITKCKKGCLISFAFLSNVIVCISLSYRFMSPTFGVAFLLSILAAWVMIRIETPWLAIALGAITMAFSMGAYQAYVGCTCMVVVGYLLHLLISSNKQPKEILLLGGRCCLAGALGCLLYVIILKIHLAVLNVAMSDYNGASAYTIKNTFQNILSSIQRTYEAFKLYFFGSYFLSNVFQDNKLYLLIFVLLGLMLFSVAVRFWKENKRKVILLIVLVLIIPIACGAILLVATNTTLSMQMTAGWGICVPVLFCVVYRIKQENKVQKLLNVICILLTFAFIYGNVQQVTLDQNAMLEGKIATTTMAKDIVSRLGEEDCLSPDLEYCVIGLPVGSPTFAVSNLYSEANTYAAFGVWWTDASCSRRSWNGVFRYLCGVNMNMASVETYNSIMTREEVMNMPAYPDYGFIYREDNVVVIRIAP